MKLILKYTLRNIIIKPLRTAIIILCLGAVSLAFSLCLSINIASEDFIENEIRTTIGKTDITMGLQSCFDEKLTLPNDETDVLYVTNTTVNLQLHKIENFKYVQKKQVGIFGTDAEAAYNFGMLPECQKISNDEAIITSAVANMFGYDEGDIIKVPCADGNETELKIKKIFLCEKILFVAPMTVITTPEKAAEIMCKDNVVGNVAYIDVLDNNKISDIYENLIGNYPDYISQQVMGTSDVNEMISGLTGTFFLIFAVVLLMIVFIISAFSKNIATERITTIGTLRSIGANKTTAAFSLILECAIYGFIGGILGTVFFYGVKDFVIGNFLASPLYNTVSYDIPIYIPIFSLFLSAILSCICSLAAIIGVTRKSIREIIFTTKDTAYRSSLFLFVLGCVIFIISLILVVFDVEFTLKLIALIFFILGICLIIPFLLSKVSMLVMKYSSGYRIPVIRLSLIQLGTKKTLISQAVICTSVLTLTVAVCVLTCSVDTLYSFRNYNCDAVISELSQSAERYENIIDSKMVENSELIYNTEETVSINGERLNVFVFGYDGFEMFSGISDVPSEIMENEIVIDKSVMKRMDICEGDKVQISFKENTVRPVTMTFTVKAGCDSIYYDMRCNSILINMDTYKEIYYNYPSTLLVKVADTYSTDNIKNLVVDNQAVFKTVEEYYEDAEAEKSSIINILGAMLILGFSLAIISAAGNHSVGFEQRKHEFAVLFSSGMSKWQLIKMLITESILSVGFSAMISIASITITIEILSDLLSMLEIQIPIFWDGAVIFMFIAVISVAVILTVLSPIFSLMKMNTAEQLKHE